MKGQNVLITGAASGIGQACALELAKRGAMLLLVDIDAEGLSRTAEAVESGGGRAWKFTVDLTKREAIDALVADVHREVGSIDVLMNNAGVAVAAPLLGTSDADWDWIFAVNVWAPIHLTRAFLPDMLERRRGHVVMTASLAGLIGCPGMPAYSTTKFALVGFAEALRLEVLESGVEVTTICPGFVRTNLHRATRYRNDGFQQFLGEPPAWYGISREKAARRIVNAIAKKRPLLVFGMEKIGWWLKRLWPRAAFAVTRWAGRRAGVLRPSP